LEKAVNSLPAGLEGLIALVKILRGDHGCPWDREQTPEQIKTYLLEETYEVLEALESGNSEDVCAELGDVLFHIVFLARIFEEYGDFNIRDVVETISKKMIRRHPHVFGQTHVSCSDEVRDRWHEIKIAEAKDKDRGPNHFLDSVPQKLPALIRAYRISERAAKLGFEWQDVDGVLKNLDKELAEFKSALKRENSEKSAEVLGDLLFTTVNLCRFMRIHPEEALTRTISKFIKRFQVVEQLLREQGRTLESVSPDEMDAIWEQDKIDKDILTGEKDN
jgi:MazG family protein